MKQLKILTKKFFTDKRGDLVIAQPPNPPLILWLIFTVTGFVLPDGGIKDMAHWAALLSLVVWASLEILTGVNGFRRTLGFVVLVSAVFPLNRLFFS